MEQLDRNATEATPCCKAGNFATREDAQAYWDEDVDAMIHFGAKIITVDPATGMEIAA